MSQFEIIIIWTVKSHSTSHALVDFLNKWHTSCGRATCHQFFFTDYAKAFDHVDHFNMITWLAVLVNDRSLDSLIFMNCEQHVKPRNGSLNRGMPQGTHLSSFYYQRPSYWTCCCSSTGCLLQTWFILVQCEHGFTSHHLNSYILTGLQTTSTCSVSALLTCSDWDCLQTWRYVSRSHHCCNLYIKIIFKSHLKLNNCFLQRNWFLLYNLTIYQHLHCSYMMN